MSIKYLYHICARTDWPPGDMRDGEDVYLGSPLCRRDGFIHLSRAHQVGETLRRYFVGRDDLCLLQIDADALPLAPVWTPIPARGEALPHLYAALPVRAVVEVLPLPLDHDGHQILPDLPEEA